MLEENYALRKLAEVCTASIQRIRTKAEIRDLGVRSRA